MGLHARARRGDDNFAILCSTVEVFAARKGHAFAYMDMSLGFGIATDLVVPNHNTLARTAIYFSSDRDD